jgi:predicted DNA-binding transcriptional regulator AlpA
MNNAKLTTAPANESGQTAPEKQGQAFLTEKQLLARIPVSRRTLWNWRTSKKIPSIKIGRRVLFCWENVAEALRRLETGAE